MSPTQRTEPEQNERELQYLMDEVQKLLVFALNNHIDHVEFELRRNADVQESVGSIRRVLTIPHFTD